jgi:hypothetical protein
LMAMKQQGVWYFLCYAPEHCERIAPHYRTFGPPPPPCCPPPAPCGPAPVQKVTK